MVVFSLDLRAQGRTVGLWEPSLHALTDRYLKLDPLLVMRTGDT